MDLHHRVWLLATDWLRNGHKRAMQCLDEARSQRRFAGGIDEIWPLANEGRIELLRRWLVLAIEASFAPCRAVRSWGFHNAYRAPFKSLATAF